jgi:hypothetical protein
LRATLGLLLTLLVLVLALPGEGAGSSPFWPTLTVGVFGGNFATGGHMLDLTVDLVGQTSLPGRITIYVPDRFQIQPSRDPGTPVGKGFVFLRNVTSSTTQYTLYSGPISAEPVDAVGEAAAQACSPGTHSAVWLLHLRHKSQTLDIPMYLAPTGSGDPQGAMLKLELCPPAGPVVGAFTSLVLSLSDLEPPATPGRYQWRAIVTPLTADHTARSTAAAYELRASFPVPHVLTLRGRYLPGTRTARLTGTLRARGHALAHEFVELTQLDRTITVHGPVFHDAAAAFAQTNHDGTYAITVPLHATRGFLASSPPTIGGCIGSSAAPAGCRSSSTAGIESDPITISVP